MDVKDVKLMTNYYRSRTIGVIASLFPLAFLAVCLRFYCRRLSRTPIWWDDWTSVVALIMSGCFIICNLLSLPGQDVLSGATPLSAELAEYNSKGSYVAELFYYLVQGAVKVSMLLFYWRIFSSSNYISISIKCMSVYIFMWFTASFITAALQCVPVAGAWSAAVKADPNTKCIDLNAFFFGTSTPNIIADLVLVLLPIPQVLQLKIHWVQKLFVISFFALGSFVVVTSIVRLSLLPHVQFSTFPYNWSMEDSVTWTLIENNCAVIGVCLPSLKPILNLLPWNMSLSSSYGKSAGGVNSQGFPATIGGSGAHGSRPRGQWSQIGGSRSDTRDMGLESGIRKETRFEMNIELDDKSRGSSQDHLPGHAA